MLISANLKQILQQILLHKYFTCKSAVMTNQFSPPPGAMEVVLHLLLVLLLLGVYLLAVTIILTMVEVIT